LRDLSTEDLRLLVGQNIGLHYLIPLALDLLEVDPWSEGDFYRGDLLMSVVQVETSFWSEHPEAVGRYQAVLDSIEEQWAFYREEILPKWSGVFGGSPSI
jgi:hypothetical protein